MSKHQLGEFEEIVMLTIGVLNDKAYGLAIKKEIEERLNRSVSMGALHTALYRLEAKGFLTSELGEATKMRGGKPKRFFKVTVHGQKNLQQAMDDRQQLWKDIPAGVFELNPSSK
ncbi:MAG: helix-turn-helix transcriptional regulator [Cyclobacteriaceae bacterium]